MKKRILTTLLLIVIIISGCSKSEMNDAEIIKQELRIKELDSVITELENTKAELESIIPVIKEEKGVAKYIVKINIKQSHFTLDLNEMLKDELNDITIEIPVDKEFYDSVEIGTVLDDTFRLGSLLLKGSIGSCDVTITEKAIK